MASCLVGSMEPRYCSEHYDLYMDKIIRPFTEWLLNVVPGSKLEEEVDRFIESNVGIIHM